MLVEGSCKFIKICKSFYVHASLSVRTSESVSQKADMKEGTLFFRMFLERFRVSFKENWFECISMDFRNDILGTAYGKNVATFVSYCIDLERKTKNLRAYCAISETSVDKKKLRFSFWTRLYIKKELTRFMVKIRRWKLLTSYDISVSDIQLGLIFRGPQKYEKICSKCSKSSHEDSLGSSIEFMVDIMEN